MFDALKAVGWRNRFILPALKQAALRNGHVAESPDVMILVELWLWAVFFRFSGEYRALPPHKQAKLRGEAFQLSFFDYRNLHKDRLAAMMKEHEPNLRPTDTSAVLVGFYQLIGPTFEHSVAEAQALPPLHESFDLTTFRRVLSKVHPSFLEMPGMGTGGQERERQRNLKLVTQAAAVGQAQLYAALTGMLIPADTVLVKEEQIPDLADVFISYARPDAEFVSGLALHLERSGLAVWYDRRIQPEQQFDQAISEQIAASKVVLTVWSSASVGSKWVRAESLAGFNANKLLQVRIAVCEIPTPFNIVQTVTVDPSDSTSEGFAVLLEAVQRMIGATPVTKAASSTRADNTTSDGAKPWYYDHKTWREALIVPALREAEPVLYLKDPKVGFAAQLLLETFFWGFALNLLQFKVSSDDMEHIIPMLGVTAPTQFCEEAKERGANIEGPVSMEFIGMFHFLIGASTEVVESELRKHGQFQTPVPQLFMQFLAKSEAAIPTQERHAAFPVSGADGDVLLGVAVLAGSTKLFEAFNATVLKA